MDVTEIVKAIMSTEVNDFVLLRSFSKTPISKVMTCHLNELLGEAPDLQDTIIALSILAPLRWVLGNKEIHKVMERICEDDNELKHLGKVQNVIVEATAMEPKLLLQNRTAYFDACEALVNTVETSISQIEQYPENGETYALLLNLLTDKPDLAFPSKYTVNKHLKDAIFVLHENYGDIIDEHLDTILSGMMRAEDDVSHVYHDISCLLTEYYKILWRANNSDDRAMQLLACKSEEEMFKITKSDEAYRQAYLIVEYIKLVNGAVESLKSFPVTGHEYYSIVKKIIELKPLKASDEDVARKLGISTYSFSVKRRRALSVLSSILWGCDGDTFIHLLTEVA